VAFRFRVIRDIMSDEFLRDRPLEAEVAASDGDTGQFPRRNRMAQLEKVIKKHKGNYDFTSVGGLAVRIGGKVYAPDGRDITPQPPDSGL
jgi:hypothetical protein